MTVRLPYVEAPLRIVMVADSPAPATLRNRSPQPPSKAGERNTGPAVHPENVGVLLPVPRAA